MGKDASLKGFFLGISAATQIPTSSQLWGLRQDPAKPLLLRGWRKQWVTLLSQRKSMAKKAPAKKKHGPAPRNISEI